MTLTGDWAGVYDYDGDGDPVAFNASLFDVGGVIWGSTEERVRVGFFVADLSGMRSGEEVRFAKTYRGAPEGFAEEVSYMGLVSASGDRIEGRWEIGFAGVLGRGPFVMTRPLRAMEQLKQVAEAAQDAEL